MSPLTIEPGIDIAALAAEHGVKFIRKDESRLHRFLGWLFMLVGYDYMNRAWTTIGKTIAYPVTGPQSYPVKLERLTNNEAYLERHRGIIEHEFIHILQRKRWWLLHDLGYLLFPLPVFCAWYRAEAELQAYAHECAFYGRDQAEVVETLWKVYAWPMPRTWMRRRLKVLVERLTPNIEVRRCPS